MTKLTWRWLPCKSCSLLLYEEHLLVSQLIHWLKINKGASKLLVWDTNKLQLSHTNLIRRLHFSFKTFFRSNKFAYTYDLSSENLVTLMAYCRTHKYRVKRNKIEQVNSYSGNNATTRFKSRTTNSLILQVNHLVTWCLHKGYWQLQL